MKSYKLLPIALAALMILAVLPVGVFASGSDYTYTVTNYPNAQDTQANLYLHEDTLVAADLFSAGENGFIAPLFTE